MTCCAMTVPTRVLSCEGRFSVNGGGIPIELSQDHYIKKRTHQHLGSDLIMFANNGKGKRSRGRPLKCVRPVPVADADTDRQPAALLCVRAI